MAEEGKLKTEATAVCGVQISGVVPPFGLEIGMIEVIAGKLVTIARQRELVRIASGA